MTDFKNFKRKIIITICAVITMSLVGVLLFRAQSTKLTQDFDTSQDFIKFLDVGQGDCALIYSNGYCALIDTGLPSTAKDVSKDLKQYGISEIDTIVISHLHSDHVGGLPQIAKSFDVENLIMPCLLKDSIDEAKNGKKICTKQGTKYYDAQQGMSFNIGEFEITLLSDFSSENENNRSLFVMAKINDYEFLMTGDAEAEAENLLLNENLNLDCDVLKVSHHGSNTSSCEKFLNAVTPQYSVISVGKDNSYSHPHQETLNSLKKAGSQIYRTDQSGDVTFLVEDNKFKISTEYSK